MFWEKKEFTYSILVPPLSKEIDKLNADEAEDFFKWYQDRIQERIDYLSCFCLDYLKLKREKLKFEPQSLVYIWECFLKVAEIEVKLENKTTDIKDDKKKSVDMFEDYDARQLSLQTEYILRDIGMYLGEMFVKYHPQIYWSFYTEPKTDFFVNQPLLLGFEDKEFTPPFQMEFEPIHMVGVQAANLFDGTQKKTDLLNLYRKWEKYLPE